MFTVKHVERDGHEGVVQADSVIFDPAVGENNEYPKGQVVAFGVPQPTSDGCNRYGNGVVYVMNDRGSTVAKYNLD
jgi:hypothetical protein